MSESKTTCSARDVALRGRTIYDQKIRGKVESENLGKYLVLDVDSGDYEIDADHVAASDRMATRKPGAVLYSIRIGFPTAGTMGARVRRQ